MIISRRPGKDGCRTARCPATVRPAAARGAELAVQALFGRGDAGVALDTDLGSGELLAAQLLQVLGLHEASHGRQVRSYSREPPHGDQDLGRGQDAHHDRRAYAPLDDHRDAETAIRRKQQPSKQLALLRALRARRLAGQ